MAFAKDCLHCTDCSTLPGLVTISTHTCAQYVCVLVFGRCIIAAWLLAGLIRGGFVLDKDG
jgi:hypothetical protein